MFTGQLRLVIVGENEGKGHELHGCLFSFDSIPLGLLDNA